MAIWLPIILGLAPFLAIGLALGTYAARRLALLDNRCQIEFAKLERELRKRHRAVEELSDAAESTLDSSNESLDDVNAARRQSELVLARLLADTTSPEALRAIGSTERSLLSALASFDPTLDEFPSLAEDTLIVAVRSDIKASEHRIRCLCMNFNDAVMIFNAFRGCVPGRLFSSMLGYASDRGQLDLTIEHSNQTQHSLASHG
jgi:hypothetical protein